MSKDLMSQPSTLLPCDPYRIFICGSGGDGVLFTGKLLAQAALRAGLELSWLPSYGPEMRGGTANCSVVLSRQVVASPIIDQADLMLIFNQAAWLKYGARLAPGGLILADQSAFPDGPGAVKLKADAQIHALAAKQEAAARLGRNLGNMLLLGALTELLPLFSIADLLQCLQHSLAAKSPELLELNEQALSLGQRLMARELRGQF
ncbi:2-oxoacid:ferredoxin oxidoreductase subunit gamma [Oscillospiraceae bacterium HV4-5-C5C]|nr:2-oxoacid:ferredoxin oxidoreductase subunit gamma [Oscillospiraceae bacterium HV4-5-C5C]